MKHKLWTLVAALAVTCMLAGGLVALNPTPVSAQTDTPDVIEVVETLDWEGTPTAGWGSVLKNQHCEGRDLIVNGVTYNRNSIGSHLPGSGTQDIVYDISAYSTTHPYFTMKVAQPDGAANKVRFTVLADDVAVDEVVWAHAGGGNNTRGPILMKANVAGATKLTLRIQSELGYFNDGAIAFLDLKLHRSLYDAEDGYASATMLLERGNATDGGYDAGFGYKPVLNAQMDGEPLSYLIYTDTVTYADGFGTHLRNVSYETYAADKTNTNNFISFKWNVKDKSFSSFSSIVTANLGYGYHVDAWADGVEIYTSGKLDSIGTYAATGGDARHGLHEVNFAIPAGAEELELRLIADTVFNDGQVEFCAPRFLIRDDASLFALAATQTVSSVWPFAAARGLMWDGQVATYHDEETNTDVVAPDGIYFIAGSSYVFDISNVAYNSLVGTVGRAPYFPDHEEAKPVHIVATVTYEDGSSQEMSSEGIDWSNSGKDNMTLAHWGEGAKTLKLEAWAENPSFSETVLANATFVDKFAVIFDDGTTSTVTLCDTGDSIVVPSNTPSRVGYTFDGWALKGESTEFDFATGKVGTQDMTFEPLFTENSYSISWMKKLGDEAAVAASGYTPETKLYTQAVTLPAAQTVEGYTFDGWYVEENKVTELAANAYTDTITVVAKYTLNTYTVTFVNGTEEVDERTVAHGSTVTLPNVQKTGYDFAGWTANGSAFDATTEVTANTTVEATWTAKTFAITYQHKLGGAAATAATGYAPAQHTYDTATVLPAAQTVEGYTFDGWYVGTSKVTELGATDYLEAITVVARYTLNTYTVRFVVDGETTTVTYDHGATIGDRIAEKDGYTFDGWFVDEQCTQAYDATTGLAADLTLYAGFTAIPAKGCGGLVGGGIGAGVLTLLAAGLAMLAKKKEN